MKKNKEHKPEIDTVDTAYISSGSPETLPVQATDSVYEADAVISSGLIGAVEAPDTDGAQETLELDSNKNYSEIESGEHFSETDSGSHDNTENFGAPKKIRMSRFSTMSRKKVTYTISMTIFFIIVSIFAIFALMPIVLTILNSFMSTQEIKTNYSAVFSSLSSNTSDSKTYLAKEAHLKLIPEMASVEQYATVLLKSPAYLWKFWNSLVLVVPTVIGQMITGSLAAYSFARYRRKRREILFFSYIILMLMPFQVTLVPNYLIAEKLNIINTYQAIILPGIFSTFSVFLISKYMRQIPSSYIEAAKLDGAGEWHIFTRICMPLCKSALYAMGILLFIDYWNMVEQPLILLTDKDKQPLSVFLAEINSGEVGIAFAASFIFMIPPLLIFLNGEQYLIEGISKSGLK